MNEVKELKRQVRALRKLKKNTQIHTEERRQINGQIRELKKQLKSVVVVVVPMDEEKQRLINEIKAIYRKTNRPMYVELEAYDKYQLTVHLNKLKGLYV